MSSIAPIVLFAYLRPTHLNETLSHLNNNILAEKSTLYIYIDGLKKDASEEDIYAHKKVIEYSKSVSGFKDIHIVIREQNFGLANNIISAVTEIVNKYGKVIVLEDDMITSRFFLKYMNEALNYYENEDRVISITGYMYPVEEHMNETFFLKGSDCWGWATWKRGWDLFEDDGAKLLQQLEKENKQYEFDFEGGVSYTSMLKNQILGKNNSWAVRWYASAFLNNKLSLCVGKSLIENTGIDNSGTHCNNNSEKYYSDVADLPVIIRKIKVEENINEKQKIIRHIKQNHENIQSNRIKNIIEKIIQNLIPPGIIKVWHRHIKVKEKHINNSSIDTLKWQGNYNTWNEAIKNSKGYSQDEILNTVKEALLNVKNGYAAYERDSVLFNKIEYNWPLLAILQNVALVNNGNLCIIDFGGSLGSTFFQNKSFLNNIKKLNWCIVEQSNFVNEGKKHFEDDTLKFYYTIEDCVKENTPNVLLLSSVIQYLPNPYEWLDTFIDLNIDYIIVDNTAYINGEQDIITVQHVPESIYNASYPCWFFNELNISSKLVEKYRKISEYNSHEGFVIDINNFKASYKSSIWKKI